MEEKLMLTHRKKFGYDIIDIVGEISFEDSKRIEEFISTELAADKVQVILNFAKVPFINSSALSLLVKIMQDLSSKGVQLYMMNTNESIRGLLDITGVKKYFKIIKDENTLIEKISSKTLDGVLELDERINIIDKKTTPSHLFLLRT